VVFVTPGGGTPSYVTFNSLGGVVSPNADGTAPITAIDICNPAITGANTRPLRVVVSPGGSVRMCDPKVTDPADARACPTPGVNAGCP